METFFIGLYHLAQGLFYIYLWALGAVITLTLYSKVYRNAFMLGESSVTETNRIFLILLWIPALVIYLAFIGPYLISTKLYLLLTSSDRA